MQIKEKYTKNVQYVSPDTPLTQVAKLMEEHDCGSVLVAENEKLAGVITDRDIVVRCVAQSKAPTEMTAGECKTPEILYCFETDEAEDVLKNMAKNKVRRMPVLNNEQNKKLMGIISLGDVSAICENKKPVAKQWRESEKPRKLSTYINLLNTVTTKINLFN